MAFNNTGGKTYTLASSISSSQTTILLTSFLEPVTGTPYTMAYLNTDIVYATLAPKTTQTEFISFTGITQNADGTALLTGVTRGLSRSWPFTSAVAYKLPHGGQTNLVLSNSPQQINEYGALKNNDVITGLWEAPDPVASQGIATKHYVLSVVSGGPITLENVDITGTAGETLAVNDVVYFKTSDQKWWLVKANDTATFLGLQTGFCKLAAAANASTSVALPIGKIDGFTGLTAGSKYYVTNAGGQPSLVAGTNSVFVGWAYSTTEMLIESPEKDALSGGGAFGVPSANNKFITETYFNTAASTIRTYKAVFGSSDTQFDITNPSGTTFRYTFDGTGTDPGITSTTMPTGSSVIVNGANFAAGNNGTFTITASGTNYFEVTNAGGSIESNKTLGLAGNIYINTYTWTKPTGLVALNVEMWAGGGSGGSSATAMGGGGGGGGYIKTTIMAASLGSTETITVGNGGARVTGNTAGAAGVNTTFGSLATAYAGGAGQGSAAGVTGGGGGGANGAGAAGAAGGAAGSPGSPFATAGTTAGTAASAAILGGGGGGGSNAPAAGAGGFGYYGGGGGGGADASGGNAQGAGGASLFGGAGGGGNFAGNGTDGAVKGGGGGASVAGYSGRGGGGYVILTEIF